MIFNLRKISDTITPQIRSIQRTISGSGRRKILVTMGQKFIDMTLSNFSTSKYRENNWAPLTPKYAKRVGHSKATLGGQSGKLAKSIQMNSPRQNFVEVYTRNPFADLHTFGNRKRNIPKRNFWPIQFSTPSYSRLLFNAEKEMVFEIGKRLSIQSGGTLPRLSSAIVRSPFQYGSVFTSPMSSET